MLTMKKIFVTKPYLPARESFQQKIDQIWANEHLTNQGPLLTDLETRLKDFLETPYFHFVTNGTLALQLALRAFDITSGEVITTPFSYVATTSSILWEGCTPVFVDIDPHSFCIDVSKVEAAITPRTRAIMAVHVFGYPCDVEALEDIAKRHNLKVIYDAAHAFGGNYKGKSLLSYGDAATCSFHATKVFHTIEGGCVITHDEKTHKKVGLLKSFGHIGDDHFCLGINAKASEFQAAMGLCNLADFSTIVKNRAQVAAWYDQYLPLETLQRPASPRDFEYNHAYYPVVFSSAELCTHVIDALTAENVIPRRYFFPSLNTLSYLKDHLPCPVSESIALRVLSLPFHAALEEEVVKKVSDIVKRVVNAQ
jgi:dTDP-4-amino-4,6-dideoxygalactose transaminase